MTIKKFLIYCSIIGERCLHLHTDFEYYLGQGMGGQTTGGEVVWNDDVSLDEIGSSPMLSVSSDSSSYPVHLGAIEGLRRVLCIIHRL